MPTPFDTSRSERRHFDATAVHTFIVCALQALQLQAPNVEGSADAELITACAVTGLIWERHHHAIYSDQFSNDDDRDIFLNGLWEQAEPLLARISDMRASTLEGHRARAAIYLAWSAGPLTSHVKFSGNELSRLALSLVIDLIATATTANEIDQQSTTQTLATVDSNPNFLAERVAEPIQSTERQPPGFWQAICSRIGDTLRKWLRN
jgi:hypothetical protein